MRQAITTKYHGPTNHRGARVTARAQAGSKTYSWDYSLGVGENHTKAAKAFAEAWGWLDGHEIVSGMDFANQGVHVLVPVSAGAHASRALEE